MNYTKGEWKVEEDNLGCKNIIVDKQEIFSIGGDTNEIGYTTGLSNEEQDLANAHLIAAAPEMYEALKEMVRHFNQDVLNTYFDNKTLNPAKQALAKAEGKI
jgi:hypothetical protein